MLSINVTMAAVEIRLLGLQLPETQSQVMLELCDEGALATQEQYQCTESNHPNIVFSYASSWFKSHRGR